MRPHFANPATHHIAFCRVPEVALGAAAVNANLSIVMGRDRWILLSSGLTQVSVLALMIVAGWLRALGYRRKSPPEGDREFDVLQVFLAGLTLAALVCLFRAIKRGLLGLPFNRSAASWPRRELVWERLKSRKRGAIVGVMDVGPSPQFDPAPEPQRPSPTRASPGESSLDGRSSQGTTPVVAAVLAGVAVLVMLGLTVPSRRPAPIEPAASSAGPATLPAPGLSMPQASDHLVPFVPPAGADACARGLASLEPGFAAGASLGVPPSWEERKPWNFKQPQYAFLRRAESQVPTPACGP